MQYIIERVWTKAGFDGALINSDRSKAFNKVDHHYLEADFRPVFRGWTTVMHRGTCLVVKVNDCLLEPFGIASSFYQGCSLPPPLYVITLDLQKLEQLRGILFELGYRRAVSMYADDITIMVSDAFEVEIVNSILTEYELAARAKINTDLYLD